MRYLSILFVTSILLAQGTVEPRLLKQSGATPGQQLVWRNGEWRPETLELQLTDLTDVGSKRGNSTQVQMTTGAVNTNDCAKFDANGNLISAGAECGEGGGGVSDSIGFKTTKVGAVLSVTAGLVSHNATSSSAEAGTFTIKTYAISAVTAANPTVITISDTTYVLEGQYLSIQGATGTGCSALNSVHEAVEVVNGTQIRIAVDMTGCTYAGNGIAGDLSDESNLASINAGDGIITYTLTNAGEIIEPSIEGAVYVTISALDLRSKIRIARVTISAAEQWNTIEDRRPLHSRCPVVPGDGLEILEDCTLRTTGDAGASTVQIDGTPIGTRATINLKTGLGIALAGLDTGTVTEITFSSDTAVVPTKANIQAGTPLFCNSTTGNDTYTCSLSPALTAYTTGACFTLLTNFSNAGTATLNINTLGAKSIFNRTGGALIDADIVSGKPTQVCYDGTQFIGSWTNVALAPLLYSAQSTSFTATSNTAYWITGNSVAVTLPVSPADNDFVVVVNGTVVTGCSVLRNGKNIMGLAENMTIDTSNFLIKLVFRSASNDWRLAI